jgi:hypothetical protein
MSKSRGHHHISQTYLRGFSKKREKIAKLFVVDLKAGVSFRSNTTKVAKRRDFNRVDIEELDPNVIEDALGKFESIAAPALIRIEEQLSLADDEDRSILFNLVALFALGNPKLRKIRSDFREQVGLHLLQIIKETPDRWDSIRTQMELDGYIPESNDPSDFEKIRKLARSGGFSVVTPTNTHIASELGLIQLNLV